MVRHVLFLASIINKMKINLNKYKVFFFDFDGVIVDSLNIKTKAFGELFARYGEQVSNEVMEYHRNNGGVSRYEKFRYYYKNLLNKEINQRIIDRLDKDYSKLVVKKVIAAPYIKGALLFIGKLNQMKKDCFIISGTPQKEVRRILKCKKIDRFFKDVVGSPANKTENLGKILNRYNINPSEAVYFGDAKSDYEAAKINKVDFTGFVNKESKELKGINSIFKVKDFNIIIGQL